MRSLRQNNTWVLVKKSIDAKVVRRMWVYKLKDGLDKVIVVKYKARVMA